MKAPIKSESIEPVKHREKKAQDIENAMYNIEVKNISRIIGIDPL